MKRYSSNFLPLFLSVILLFLAVDKSFAETHYITQEGAGLHDGTYGNEWSVDEFNDSIRWNSIYADDGYIGPGDVVYFLGIIKATLFPKGNGTIKNRITLNGQNASFISSLGESIIHIENSNYLRLINFQMMSNVESPTLNGIGGDNSAAIKIVSCGYTEVDNCDISKFRNGILVLNGSHDLGFTRNAIHDNTESGIFFISNKKCSESYNVIIGGNRKNGNTFRNNQYKTTKQYNAVAYDVRVSGGHHDLIISYNHMYADSASGRGMSGILIHSAHNILVEYNTIHGHNTVNQRPCISIKGGDNGEKSAYNLIVRYNNLYDRFKDRSYVGRPGGIICSGNHNNIYIYGNCIHNLGLGIGLNNAEWISPPTQSDGAGIYSEYVFYNIIYNVNSGIWLHGREIANPDDFRNIYILNNTICKTKSDSYVFSSNLGIELSDNVLDDIFVKNNVFIDGRISAIMKYNLYSESYTATYVDYNHFYNTYGDANVYFGNTTCDPCAWNSDSIPESKCDHASGGNPLLDFSNFQISSSDSPLVDSGDNLGTDSINTMIINKKDYTIRWSEALSPKTDWSTIPPTIVTADQNNYGYGWERGAYIYNESRITPFSNQ